MSRDEGIVQLVLQRADILEELLDEPATKPALVDATPNSRSTVDRAVEELLEAELVEQVGSAYRATAAARHLVEALDEFVGDANAVYEAREVLAPLDDERLPPAVLRGAEVFEGHPNMPETVVKRGMELVREADSLRFCSPVQLDIYHEVTADLVLEGDLHAESVYDPGRLEVFRQEYPDQFRRLAASDHFEAYVAESVPAYTLALAETADGPVALVATHSERGVQGGIVNDADRAVAWVEETLDAVRADAELVGPVDGESADAPE